MIRKLIADIALEIYIKLGGNEMMAMLFACRVVEGRTEFDKVPIKLKQATADVIINEFGLPEVIPVEFGGTAE